MEVITMTLWNVYNKIFVPNWHNNHEEGEPPCFEEWKNNEFHEFLEDWFDNLTYSEQTNFLRSYAEDTGNFPVCYDLDSIGDGCDFIQLYNAIDHDNFCTNHELYWEGSSGYIRSGDCCHYVDEYYEDWKEEILEHILKHWSAFSIDGDLNDVDCDYEEYLDRY
jgi:hypothetical protein